MPRRLSALAMLLATLAASPAWAGALRTDVGLFSLGDMAGWQPKRFAGRTRYSLVRAQGRLVLRAVSHASASGLYRRVHVDLARTPCLHWSWRGAHGLAPPPHAGPRRGGLASRRRRYLVYAGICLVGLLLLALRPVAVSYPEIRMEGGGRAGARGW